MTDTQKVDWTQPGGTSARNPAPTSADLLDRMEALVRRMAADNRFCLAVELEEARAIVALLPKPVDPVVQKAREIVALVCTYKDEHGVLSYDDVMGGQADEYGFMKELVSSLRSGSALQAGEG